MHQPLVWAFAPPTPHRYAVPARAKYHIYAAASALPELFSLYAFLAVCVGLIVEFS